MLRRAFPGVTRGSAGASVSAAAASMTTTPPSSLARIGVPTTVGAGDFKPTPAMWSASVSFSTTTTAAAAAVATAAPTVSSAPPPPAAGSPLPSSPSAETLVGRLTNIFVYRSPAMGGSPASLHTTPSLSAPSRRSTKPRYTTAQRGRPVRAARHGASTVVGRNRVHTTAESFRQAIKAPPFPKAKFTRELSKYRAHKEAEARAALEAQHPELFRARPTATGAAEASRGANVNTTARDVSASPASTAGALWKAQALDAAPAQPSGPVPSELLDAEGDARTTAEVLAEAQARVQAKATDTSTSSATRTSTGARYVWGRSVTAVVPFHRARAALMTVPRGVNALKVRATAPLAFFHFSVRDRVGVYVSLAVALAATYGLYRLLYFELVYYGLLRTPNKKKNAAAAKKSASPPPPPPSSSSSSSSGTLTATAGKASSTSTGPATPSAATAAPAARSPAAAGAPASHSANSAATTSAAATMTTNSTKTTGAASSSNSLLYAAEYYSCAALVLLGFTVPYHVFFLGTASLMGKRAHAKKFLADWARALLPSRMAASYGRLIRAPGAAGRTSAAR